MLFCLLGPLKLSANYKQFAIKIGYEYYFLLISSYSSTLCYWQQVGYMSEIKYSKWGGGMFGDYWGFCKSLSSRVLKRINWSESSTYGVQATHVYMTCPFVVSNPVADFYEKGPNNILNGNQSGSVMVLL